MDRAENIISDSLAVAAASDWMMVGIVLAVAFLVLLLICAAYLLQSGLIHEIVGKIIMRYVKPQEHMFKHIPFSSCQLLHDFL